MEKMEKRRLGATDSLLLCGGGGGRLQGIVVPRLKRERDGEKRQHKNWGEQFVRSPQEPHIEQRQETKPFPAFRWKRNGSEEEGEGERRRRRRRRKVDARWKFLKASSLRPFPCPPGGGSGIPKTYLPEYRRSIRTYVNTTRYAFSASQMWKCRMLFSDPRFDRRRRGEEEVGGRGRL